MDNFSENTNFDAAVAIYPVVTAEDLYTLHAYFSRLTATRVVIESNTLSKEILSLGPKLPETHKEILWPVGRRPGSSPSSRFDFSKHIYFNLTHKYFHSDYSNVASLTSSERIDIKVSLLKKKT